LKHLKTQAAVLTAVLVLSFFAGTTLTAASDGEKGEETKTETAIAEGADWLVARQSENGGWTPFSVSKNNALVVRAFAATGNTSSPKYALLLSKLKALQAPDGSWDESVYATSYAIWALVEAGEEPDSPIMLNAVSWLKDHYDFSDTTEGSTATVSIVLIALIKAGEPKSSQVIVDGVNWLKTNQNDDGYWGGYQGDVSTWDGHGSSPIIALCLADSPSSSEVQKAVSWWELRLPTDNWPDIHGLEAFIAAGSESNIQTAISYVLSNQHSDGGWPHCWDWPTRNGETAKAVTALTDAGYTNGAVDKGMSWIEDHITEEGVYVGEYEHPGVISWCSSGLLQVNTTNASSSVQKAVDLLKSIQGSGGSWAWTIYHSGHVDITGLVLWSLNNYGLPSSSPIIQQGASFIIKSQNSDGGWGVYPTGTASTVSNTNYALLGLISAGYTTSNPSLVKGLDYLSRESADGNWGNTFETALATIIFQETGYNETLLNHSTGWLRANQNEDGGWGSAKGETSTTSSTALALVALNQTGETGLKIARGAAWLVAAQNEDEDGGGRGWSNLPGIPCSNPGQTAQAVWALSVANYTLEIELNLTLDKETYYPGETVKINVSSPDADEIATLNGTVTDAEGNFTNLSFDSNFTANYELTADAAPGTYTVNVVARSLNGTGTATANFDVLRLFPPTVSVATDKTEYRPGETMNTTICLANPSNTSQPVVFRWWLSIPKFDYYSLGVATSPLSLPTEYDECFSFPVTVGDWGGAGFGAFWCVGLFDPETDAIICYDTSGWNYTPAQEKGREAVTPAEIGDALVKRVEEVESQI